jgi:hypothetical protein
MILHRLRLNTSRASARFCSTRCVAKQREIFDSKVDEFKLEIPNEVVERLKKIAQSAVMSPDDRVLDVGSG